MISPWQLHADIVVQERRGPLDISFSPAAYLELRTSPYFTHQMLSPVRTTPKTILGHTFRIDKNQKDPVCLR